MRAAIVGSTGVLGRCLAPLLLAQGWQVVALARSPAKAAQVLPGAVAIHACDLLAPAAGQQLATLLAGCEAVIHAATAIPAEPTAPGAWDDNTRLRTTGVATLLQAALAAGVGQYIQQSITMAYPDCGDAWITEETPLDTAAARAAVCGPVAVMEGLVRQTAPDRLRWCIVRGASFVGPGTFQDATVAALRAGRHTVAGDGRNYVSLVHVEDMAAAIAAALVRAPAGSTFQIAAEPLREGDYLDQLADAAGAPRPRRDAAQPRPPSWRCSNRKARLLLAWEPVHALIPPFPHG